MPKDQYVKGADFDLKVARHNHTVFVRELRNRPWWGVALMTAFSVAGVLLVGWGKLSGWNPVDSTYSFWTGITSIAVAAMIGWWVFGRPLFFGDMAEVEEEQVMDSMEAKAPPDVSALPFLVLDFDGVLHPGQSGSLEKLVALQEWLRINDQVQLVISSDWRHSHAEDDLRALFEDDIRERIHGFTPKLEGAPREKEIAAYASEHGIANWVALDDVQDGFPTAGERRLVLTDRRTGLTGEDLDRVSELLGLKGAAEATT